MLTLEQLLGELGLTLATGEASAGVAVRWVHSTELLDPTPWLTGGEVLLTTGIQLGHERDQRAFVRQLAEHAIAALGFGTGFTHTELPDALVAEATECGFPVFEVPYEVPFIAISERASAHLVSAQFEALRRSVAIQAEMERLVLEERGLDEVLAPLASALGATVAILDGRGEVLGMRSAGRSPSTAQAARLGERDGALALPVVGRDRSAPQAWLVAAPDRGRFGEFERLMLQQTVTVAALELMRQRIERDTERRLAGDVLAEALTGRLETDELAARLRPFGIGERAAVLAFAMDDPLAAEAPLSRSLERSGAASLVAVRGRLLCAVVDVDGRDPTELARSARRDLQLGGDVRAAASRAAPVSSLRRSFHEARCALEAVRLRNGDDPEVAGYDDLGAFHLLLSLQDDDALRSYCHGVLAPLEEADGEYGDELLRSLDAYIEHNGHWERAAAAVYCHRHTLRYRIRRVEELTGRHLGSARDRIEFWLALRGREMTL